MESPKAVFIGEKAIGEAVKKLRSGYNFIGNFETLSDFKKNIEKKSESVLAMSPEIIFIVDQLFVSNEDLGGEDSKKFFSEIVTSLAPYCFVVVINYHEALREPIERESQGRARKYGKFYFVSPESFNQGLDDAIDDYQKNAVDERHFKVLSALLGRVVTPKEENRLEEANGGFEISEERQGVAVGSEEPYEERFGEVITVTSSKGGAGKTTTAVTIATYLAHGSETAYKKGLNKRRIKVCIVDTDIEESQVGFLVGSLNPNLVNLKAKGVINKKTLDESKHVSTRLKLDVYLGPKNGDSAKQLTDSFFRELITELKKHYDYIILDTSTKYRNSLYRDVIYPMSSAIIFVTDIVIQSIFGMARWVTKVTGSKELDNYGISKGKIGIVINKSIDNIALSKNHIRMASRGVRVVTVVPNSAKLFAHASNTNSLEVPLKHPEIAKAYSRVIDPLIKRHGIVIDVKDIVEDFGILGV